MKKKALPKKLRLNRETIRVLADPRLLRRIAGGRYPVLDPQGLVGKFRGEPVSLDCAPSLADASCDCVSQVGCSAGCTEEGCPTQKETCNSD